MNLYNNIWPVLYENCVTANRWGENRRRLKVLKKCAGDERQMYFKYYSRFINKKRSFKYVNVCEVIG